MARAPLTRRWTPEEIEKLKALLESGAAPRAIAFQLRRNVNGVRSKIAKIQRASKETANRGVVNAIAMVDIAHRRDLWTWKRGRVRRL